MRVGIARLMVICAAMIAFGAAPSMAQLATGRIDAVVADSTGAVLPGVAVDIAGPQIQTAVTDAMGEVHFLNLAPGTYTVNAKISGFSDYVNKSVNVGTGASVPLRIALSVAGVATQVTVTGETPVVDTKKTTTSTNVTVEELQNIPSSRDPWVVLQTVRASSSTASTSAAPNRGSSRTTTRRARRQRQHVEHRRHRHHRHGGDRLHADLLRLRHVPGNAGDDGRRRRAERRPPACS